MCGHAWGYNGLRQDYSFVYSGSAQKADRGSILYNGREASGHPRVFAEEAAYVPQENPLMEELTVRDNLLFVVQGKQEADGIGFERRSGFHAGCGPHAGPDGGKAFPAE